MNKAKLIKQTNGDIAVSGDLSFDTANSILVEARTLLEQSPELVMDLANVTRSDSAGLALLIEWTRFAKNKSKTIVFKNLPSQMLALASASGLDQLLPIQN
jgi:phospholipid transport system transporter-binding protein